MQIPIPDITGLLDFGVLGLFALFILLVFVLVYKLTSNLIDSLNTLNTSQALLLAKVDSLIGEVGALVAQIRISQKLANLTKNESD